MDLLKFIIIFIIFVFLLNYKKLYHFYVNYLNNNDVAHTNFNFNMVMIIVNNNFYLLTVFISLFNAIIYE